MFLILNDFYAITPCDMFVFFSDFCHTRNQSWPIFTAKYWITLFFIQLINIHSYIISLNMDDVAR